MQYNRLGSAVEQLFKISLLDMQFFFRLFAFGNVTMIDSIDPHLVIAVKDTGMQNRNIKQCSVLTFSF